MKALGIIRKVDELGRVVIPIETRRQLNINEKDPIEMFAKDDGLFIRKYKPSIRDVQREQTLTALEDLRDHGEIHREDVLNAIEYLKGE